MIKHIIIWPKASERCDWSIRITSRFVVNPLMTTSFWNEKQTNIYKLKFSMKIHEF